MTGLRGRIDQALAQPERVSGFDQRAWGLHHRRTAASERLPWWAALRQRAATIKAHTLSRLDQYLEQFADRAEAAGCTVHFAEDAAQANATIARLCQERGATLWVGAPAQHLIVKGHAAVSVRTFQRLGHRRIDQLFRQGDLRALYLVETPIDGAMEPRFGSPREVLRAYRGQVVERIGGRMPVTVHRLR